MKSLLKVNNLRISFCRDDKWQEAVHGVDFEVFEGKTLGIVGESGSGKSVSNLAVMHLLDRRKSRIEADSILLEDKDISHYNDEQMSEVRGKQIAMIFQEPMTSLNPVYKCGFQVMEAFGWQKTKVKGQKTLGMRCLSLSKAKAVNPKLIICDESVSALDVSVQAQVLNLINRLKKEFHFTYIFISHDLSVVRFMSDRVVVMYNGKIQEMNEADALFNNPQNDYTKKLIAAICKV